MPKVDTADFKNGLSFIYEGDICTIVWFQHHKPGKGGAVMRTKYKNLRSGATVERTFNAGERFEQAILDRHPMQYLYKQDDEYVLMHPGNLRSSQCQQVRFRRQYQIHQRRHGSQRRGT